MGHMRYLHKVGIRITIMKIKMGMNLELYIHVGRCEYKNIIVGYGEEYPHSLAHSIIPIYLLIFLIIHFILIISLLITRITNNEIIVEKKLLN